jgi:hypothetical protein
LGAVLFEGFALLVEVFSFLFVEVFEELFDGGFGFQGAHFCGWGKGSVGGVVGGVFHEEVVGGSGVRGGFGEVEAGDLEAVEEQSGAAWVEVVGGDALEDFSDGELDGGAVLGVGEVEGAEAGFALGWVFDGSAGGVVEVAELLVAEAGAAAAVSVGEDVAALEAGFGVGRCGEVGLHGVSFRGAGGCGNPSRVLEVNSAAVKA